MVRWLLPLCALFLAPAALEAAERPTFGVRYTVWIKPEEKAAVVKIRLRPHPEWVDWIELPVDPDRYDRFLASGELAVLAERVRWHPPAEDAWLQYRVRLESRRANGRYDGLITPDWALFRLDDLVPPWRVSFRDGTASRAKLEFRLPEGWSVATRYPRYRSGRFKVDEPRRYFDRPSGWVVMGRIGVKRETLAGTRVAVAAPLGQGFRYMDYLALLAWTLPELRRLLPDFPERLLVVGAGDPMWRGALSGPGSLYLHADRPLLSNNATSPLLHELIHVGMRARSAPGADWIVEGLAEYYSLELLRRTGTITERRHARAMAQLAEWGKAAERLDVPRAHGPITARAVGELARIDREIRSKSAGAHSLDDVVRALAAKDRAVTAERFFALVERYSRAPAGAGEGQGGD
ncbi:MAG: hypothetical protein KatS3mg124_2404 [Porticoccaceae bacterium]|nr:MAG: hypothetical protein KatS3mg124_2404 [Porticoccaceae bacterium]